ncbi:MAG: aminomethyl-transferring glycine dehydrogenase subunit GcvPA [Pseudomonadales bacterium]|nr:aminomethyl-transferring glycine dehydrogenase subunit GcvPA [Pseudomonadales bacterium]
MPFIPHTEEELADMLGVIGVKQIDDLFDEVPAEIQAPPLDGINPGINEMQMLRQLGERAAQDDNVLCFVGAGAYQHHIPAAVWDITSRGEFMTAYTPYQAEASQGTLQLVYEFQSMITQLMSMEVANASLYDGATAVAEAALMAIRANRKSKSRKLLVASSLHPLYRDVLHATLTNQKIEIVEIPFGANGIIEPNQLAEFAGQDYAALIIPQPNFFGCIESVNQLTDWGHKNGQLVIAVVNPTAMALFTPPGEWGAQGADIAVGEGQPLGVPVSSGGPYVGFMCCKQKIVRQMPGRIIGQTEDSEGNIGYTLTLQAREQHIRRSKATSNICTNEGLLVTAATIYMSLLGYKGLQGVARASHANTRSLAQKLYAIEGVEPVFDGPFFHETVIKVPGCADTILSKLAEQRILGGHALESRYPALANTILVCATEIKTEQDLQQFTTALQQCLSEIGS